MADLTQQVHIDRCMTASGPFFRHGQTRPFAFQPVGLVGLKGPRGFKAFIQDFLDIVANFLATLGINDAHFLQALGIDFAGAGVILDLLVHQGLGEHRFIPLVMTMATIAPHVDNDVLFEFLPVFHRQTGHMDTGFWIVAIHMENRCIHSLCHVTAIG